MKNFFLKIKDQSALISSNITAAAIQGLFWIYLAKVLGKTEYGELGYLLSIASLAASFAFLGLPQLIVIYRARKENILSQAYTLGLVASAIASVIVYFLTQNVIVSIIVVGLVFFGFLEADLNSRKRFLIYSANNVIRRIIMVIFALLLIQNLGVNGVLIGFALSLAAGSIGLFKFLRREKIPISTLKPKFGFMMNGYFTSLMETFLFTGDKIIIGSLSGFSILANYQLVLQPIMVLQVVISGLAVYLSPREAQRLNNKKFKMYSVGLMTVLSIISVVSIPYAIDQFLPKYGDSILAMQIIIFSIIPTMINIIFITEFYAREKSKLVLIGSVFQICIYFALILVLGTGPMGLIGISIAFLTSTVSLTVLNLFARHVTYKKIL